MQHCIAHGIIFHSQDACLKPVLAMFQREAGVASHLPDRTSLSGVAYKNTDAHT